MRYTKPSHRERWWKEGLRHSIHTCCSILTGLSRSLANCEPQAEIYMLPALILNVVTDFCIMAIPAPVIFPVKTTLLRKVSLVIIFSAGCFIMIAAILRVDFVLVQKNGSTAAIWSCREDFVAVVVGQAPIRKYCPDFKTIPTTKKYPFIASADHKSSPVRPAFTRRFWTGEMSQGSSAQRTNPSYPIQSGNDAFEMGSAKKGAGGSALQRSGMFKNAGRQPDYNVTIQSTRGNNSDGDSTDRIIESHGIMVESWVDIESESVSQGPASNSNPYHKAY